jgi:hypothetical protein
VYNTLLALAKKKTFFLSNFDPSKMEEVAKVEKEPLRIGIVGATGRMGSELVRAAVKDKDVHIVFASKDSLLHCHIIPLDLISLPKFTQQLQGTTWVRI